MSLKIPLWLLVSNLIISLPPPMALTGITVITICILTPGSKADNYLTIPNHKNTTTDEIAQLMDKGNSCVEEKNYLQAIKYYAKVNKSDPAYYPVYYNAGLAYHQLREYQRAVTCFKEYLKYNVSAPAYQSLGASLYQQTMYAEAIEAWQEALKLDATNPVVHLNIGLAFFFTPNKIDEAIKHYRLAIQYKANFVEAEYRLGQALVTKSEFKEAYKHFAEALRNDSTHASTYYLWATAHRFEYKISPAIKKMKQAITYDSTDAAWYDLLGQWFLEPSASQSINDARNAFQKAYELDPKRYPIQKIAVKTRNSPNL